MQHKFSKTSAAGDEIKHDTGLGVYNRDVGT